MRFGGLVGKSVDKESLRPVVGLFGGGLRSVRLCHADDDNIQCNFSIINLFNNLVLNVLL